MTIRSMLKGPHVEVDLSVFPPRVMIDGEHLAGVTAASITIEPSELVVLTLRIVRFDVTGGELPALGISTGDKHVQD
jgi:hypothetical protein